MAVKLNFTNNFYKYVATVLLSNSTANNTQAVNSECTSLTWVDSITETSGNVVTRAFPMGNGSGTSSYSNAAGLSLNVMRENNTPNASYYGTTSLVFGSSSQAFSPDDYNVIAPIDSGLSVSIASVHSVSMNNALMTISATVVNTSDSTININEIGLVKSLLFSVGGPNPYYFLIARGVLDDSITLSKGDAKIVSIQVSLPITAPSV